MEQLLESISDAVASLVITLSEMKVGNSQFTINIDGVRNLKLALDGPSPSSSPSLPRLQNCPREPILYISLLFDIITIGLYSFPSAHHNGSLAVPLPVLLFRPSH